MSPVIAWGELTTIIIPVSSLLVVSVLWVVKLVGELKTDLAAFKTEVAKDYASMDMLEKFETRLLFAIDKLGDRLDKKST